MFDLQGAIAAILGAVGIYSILASLRERPGGCNSACSGAGCGVGLHGTSHALRETPVRCSEAGSRTVRATEDRPDACSRPACPRRPLILPVMECLTTVERPPASHVRTSPFRGRS